MAFSRFQHQLPSQHLLGGRGKVVVLTRRQIRSLSLACVCVDTQTGSVVTAMSLFSVHSQRQCCPRLWFVTLNWKVIGLYRTEASDQM